MTKLENKFKSFLDSNSTCDKVNEEMNKLSKYELNMELNEEKFTNSFFGFCEKHFFNEVKSLSSNNQTGIKLCAPNVFLLAHKIMNNKDKYKENIYFETIHSIYQVFFFIEFSKENGANDYTFYENPPLHVIKEKDYEVYLFNIGVALLNQKNNSELLEILFSSKTPLFLKNIILSCFLLIRKTTKNLVDFINLCIPCLNHYNLYYLFYLINKNLNYKFNQIDEISYLKLEELFLHKDANNEIVKQSEINVINCNIKLNENKNKNIEFNEEISKYFNFPKENEKDKILLFFTDDNLKENQNKFLNLIQSKDAQDGKIYKIIYDNPLKDNNTINAFSFAFLLKNGLIQQMDNHFFQIYNYGNTKIELFAHVLSKYLDLINRLLNDELTKEERKELFKNSGFYKINNENILLINIDEMEEKCFYLKKNLSQTTISSLNSDPQFDAYHINQADYSSQKDNSEIDYYYTYDSEEKSLYNFGNYSFENDLRKYFKKIVCHEEKFYELPRLYFVMNFSIPLPNNQYQFITNIKLKNNKNVSYGYGVLDFVLKNDSDNDIIIDNQYLPYKEKIFMVFPKSNINNNKMIILKKSQLYFSNLNQHFLNIIGEIKLLIFF